MLRFRPLLAFAASLVGAASANDGYAGLGAGGLEFAKSADVQMETEDLFLSRSLVRVAYTFLNTSRHDVQTYVAFQLPPLAPMYAELDIAMPEEVRTAGDLNYLGFAARVDGAPISLGLEIRYFQLCTDCEDMGWGMSFLDDRSPEVTSLLTSLDVPQSYDLGKIRSWYSRLSKADRSRLIADGLFAEADGLPVPHYWMSVRYFWQQTFPARVPVTIEHAYRPILGATVPMLEQDIVEAYCIDAGTQRAIKRAEGRIQNQQYLQYVLTTAGTWKGDIGRFRMTIEKDEPADIVSLCATGVRKTGPTTFVIETANAHPSEDIRIMFVDVAK